MNPLLSPGCLARTALVSSRPASETVPRPQQMSMTDRGLPCVQHTVLLALLAAY